MKRATGAILAGLAVTFGLLFLMQALIASGHSAFTETETTRIVDFVRVDREERLERRRSKPSRPSSPEAPPPAAPPLTPEGRTTLPGAEAVRTVAAAPIAAPRVDFSITPGFDVAAGTADGDYLPIVKVAPIYPERAVARGIEGYVIVEFTVTKTGSVKDVRVVEFHPSPVFNEAAVDAALKFKYKPRVVNGEPIEVRGVLNKITFKLID